MPQSCSTPACRWCSPATTTSSPSRATSTRPRSYDDNALVQPESRAAFARLLEQGWTDAIRKKHPNETLYTFWDYMRNRWPRNAGLRLDHICC